MILEVKHLSYQYVDTERKILQDFSFRMTNQERLGLLAPSGTGKTTLCRLIGLIAVSHNKPLMDQVCTKQIRL